MDLVLDTSFLVANVIEKDVHHADAQKIMLRIKSGDWEHLILSDHVLSETLTVVQARSDHDAAKRIGEALLHSEQVTFVVAGDDFFEALRVFQDEQSGDLSLVDSLVVHHARAYGAQVATFDAKLGGMRGVETVPRPK